MRLAAIAVLFALPALAQSDGSTAPAMTTSIIPVVGSITGLDNVRWRTDVELRNDTRAEANVTITLAAAEDQPAIILPNIPPGAVIRFTDIVGEAFNLDSALSPLVVRTEGRRPITIRATIYGVRGTDFLPPQSIPIEVTMPYYAQRVLAGLSFSDVFRTNIGLVNLSEKPAMFTLALQRVPGRNLAVTRFTIAGNSLWHSPIQSIFPLITDGDNFSIVIESSSPETHVYASVIENGTDAARYVPPSIVGIAVIRTAAIDRQ
jgi:hypothetical protein